MSASDPDHAPEAAGAKPSSGPTTLGTGVAALALALLLGLQPVTTDLYLPALPLLRQDLQASMAAVQLTMSMALLAFGVAQLVMGPLSDRLGRRPVLLCGLALYALSGAAAALAPGMAGLVAARMLQGVGLAAAVVCARAMVRDLYAPHEGAQVMARGLSGLGVIALICPPLGGLLTVHGGWRAAMAALGCAGLAVLVFVARRVPETRPAPVLGQLRPPLRRQMATIVAHPGWQAWSLLITGTYAGLVLLLAGGSFVYLGALGLQPGGYGLVMAGASGVYLLGTYCCRRWLRTVGLAGAVRRGSGFTLAGGLSLLGLAMSGVEQLPLILAAHWLYCFGHGIHQPCGQAGAVGPFPQAAGTASALSGALLAGGAALAGLWLGQMLDGRLLTLAQGVAVCAVFTSTIGWTLVQRHGERFGAAAALPVPPR
ncbi:Bcr/CflA family efflux MFS transporter [Ideonella livida]|uniref:Bcr/CflA family efflux transporter n=1 Tax=Ideonella livida TaxID=2707176 RepID=A0A7C9PJ77_9BURK|nr:Bcr/CflA family efflux MFS transporter [Ideonella livida]NDY93357.1 multidrug effflux MFS transporter [Ideonella livida]